MDDDENALVSPSRSVQDLLCGIRQLLWGPNLIKQDIFNRWAQGFRFSLVEPTALEQWKGGPCAVLAAVQAFMLKILLDDYQDLTFRDRMWDEGMQRQLLVNALCEILDQCDSTKYHLVYLSHWPDDGSTTSVDQMAATYFDDVELAEDAIYYHDNLLVYTCTTIGEVRRFFVENAEMVLRGNYAVLLFLYSVIATKGLECVRSEIDTQDPLIDDTYGYGSQSLINLMITGRATTYVWDHEQDVGGLKLRGLERQSKIGFITLMEHLRYCTVGTYYKNPVYPIWVLASDTHFTVLFSDEARLVSPETDSEKARRIFKNYDPDGNNFISTTLMGDVLAELGLVHEKEYVEFMGKKMDPENLGIVLLGAFMEEFYPEETSSTPDMFRLVHYNGLLQSNRISGEVRYQMGYAVLLETDLKSICESNPILTVLQTKWSNIDINWSDEYLPSLN